jgi:hypothetical protein
MASASVYEYVAAAIVKACTEKTPKLVDAGRGPYHDACIRLTRDESLEYCLEAQYVKAQGIRFRYGLWLGSPNVVFGEWQILPEQYASRCYAYIARLAGTPTRTVTVRYAELDEFLPAAGAA